MFKAWKHSLSLCLAGLSWLLAPSAAEAWWDTGHMLTAQVAWQEMTPAAQAEATRLIELLNPLEADPARRHFVPASVWMDEVKARGLKVFDHWHYLNTPYNPDGLPSLPAVDDDNLVVVLSSLAETLNSERAGDFEKAFALRMLLHLVGDIHQPLHAVGKFSREHPEGDQGGNLTLVTGVKGIRSIHMLWDSTAGLYPSISAPDWQGQVPELARELSQRFPRQQFSASLDFAPENWAHESFQIAVKQGYEALPANGAVDAAYLAQVQEICAQRLALGGYRLAAFLNATFR